MKGILFVVIAAIIAVAWILSEDFDVTVKKVEEEDDGKKQALKNLEETTHLLDESYERERVLMKRNEELVELAADYSQISVLLYDYIWGETAHTDESLLESRRRAEFREVMKTKAWEDILATHENLFAKDEW